MPPHRSFEQLQRLIEPFGFCKGRGIAEYFRNGFIESPGAKHRLSRRQQFRQLLVAGMLLSRVLQKRKRGLSPVLIQQQLSVAQNAAQS